MKKNNKNIIHNKGNTKIDNINNLKLTTKNKNQENILNSSKQLKNKIRKIDTKPKNKKIPSQIFTSNLSSNNTISSNLPYQHILDELMKYLENKIKPQLYEDINNYLTSKINNYIIENIDKKYVKKINVDLNQDKSKNKKRNNEPYTFSSKKYKSYLNFNYMDKNKKNINKNNYIYTQFHNYKESNSIKKDKSNKKKLISKLVVSTDYLQKRLDFIGKRKKNKTIYNNYYTTSNNEQRKNSQHSFENYYKGSSENIKNFSYENNVKKIDSKNKSDRNNIYKKLKVLNKDNLKFNKKDIENVLKKNKLKLNNKNAQFINKLNYKYNSKEKNNINNIENYRINLNISSQNKNKSYNINNKNNKINNNSYIKNEYINNNSNNNLQNQNITINVNLTQRPFINKINLLNEKLMNKLKISMHKNNKISNSIENKAKKPYNLKNYTIFTKLTKNYYSNNNNNLLNKGLINKKINKMNFLNIKKAKSYRINNNIINKTTSLSIRKKSIEKTNNKNNNNKKLDKNNFLKIVNNITDKKEINDKKYIHIDSLEINNIIKRNDKEDNNIDSINIDNKNGSHKYQNFNVTNEELMKKIKNSLDDNLKVMLNFSYENFLSKESERE